MCTIQCRNGEGALAQHIFPKTDGAVVRYLAVNGIERTKLKDMSCAVRQHRKQSGKAFSVSAQPSKRQKVVSKAKESATESRETNELMDMINLHSNLENAAFQHIQCEFDSLWGDGKLFAPSPIPMPPSLQLFSASAPASCSAETYIQEGESTVIHACSKTPSATSSWDMDLHAP